MKTLPKPPFRPSALLRVHQPSFESPRTSAVLAHWNHADRPPPSFSSPLKPISLPGVCRMSTFCRSPVPNVPWSIIEYSTYKVPKTWTVLDCASATAGAANAPATATAMSFFCITISCDVFESRYSDEPLLNTLTPPDGGCSKYAQRLERASTDL